MDDLTVPKEKKALIEEAEKKIKEVENYFEKGLLTKEEKRIYDSIMKSFPNTHPDSAFNVAIQGGVKFQYISK